MPSSEVAGSVAQLGRLLLADGRMPSGGYAYSGSLEPAVVAGLRTAAQNLGRGLARLADRLFPDAPATAALSAMTPRPSRPIALGALAGLFGLAEPDAARAALYDDVQTVTAASLKLLPVDPADTVGWVLDVADEVERGVEAAVACPGIDDLPAHGAPLIDQFSLIHHHRTRRIFVA